MHSLNNSNFPLRDRVAGDIIYNAIVAASYRGRYFEFSSANAENSLVPLPARRERKRPDDAFYNDKPASDNHVGSFS